MSSQSVYVFGVWLSGITDTSFEKGEIRFNTNFSQSLPKSGWRLIGRYEDGVSGVYLVLGLR